MKTNDTTQTHTASPLTLREHVLPADGDAIRAIVAATGRFYPNEVDVAVELVHEYLAKGEASGYLFTIGELDGRVAGYACYGPTPCTQGTFDLYWIAVDPSLQGRGYGRVLIDAAETRIARAGGVRIFLDTSSRADHVPTCAFYERCGYKKLAQLKDFYLVGDDKVVYGKGL